MSAQFSKLPSNTRATGAEVKLSGSGHQKGYSRIKYSLESISKEKRDWGRMKELILTIIFNQIERSKRMFQKRRQDQMNR